jgi:hypothetical protein
LDKLFTELATPRNLQSCDSCEAKAIRKLCSFLQLCLIGLLQKSPVMLDMTLVWLIRFRLIQDISG